jgi:general secretion pathway protein A
MFQKFNVCRGFYYGRSILQRNYEKLEKKLSVRQKIDHARTTESPNLQQKQDIDQGEIQMSYLRYWKLNASPFRHPQHADEVYTGGTVEEALARCEFAVTQRNRLSLVIGPSGVGKSIVSHRLGQLRLLKTTNEHSCIVGFQGQTPFDIVRSAVQQLDPDLPQEFTNLEQLLLRFSEVVTSLRIVGHHCIFVADEANNLTDSQLELIARLVRIPGLSTMLCVNEEGLVDLPRWIMEMSEMRIPLPSWDLGQVADFFDFSFQIVGGDPNIFDAQAITRVQELSNGIPRKIAQIADLALVSGAVRRSGQVSAELIDEVCNEFTLSVGTNFPVFWDTTQLKS